MFEVKRFISNYVHDDQCVEIYGMTCNVEKTKHFAFDSCSFEKNCI